MRIQHNIPAMNAYRNYTGNTKALSKNLEKLSSGYKINRAGDDAAGLAISEKMRAQITGLKAAQKNAKDGISLVQTAEGALTEVHSMLNRMVDLADQSANGTFDDTTDRANLQKEVAQLKSEIDRIADATNFNGIKLLNGALSSGGAAGAAGVPSISGLELTDVAATKGSANSANFADITGGAADGGNLSMTINYTDAAGKNQAVTVKFTIDDTSKKLIAEDGTEYSFTSLTSIKKGEQQDAFLAELNKTELGKSFKITKATDALKFEAKEAGASTAITSIIADLDGDATLTDGALQTLASVTAGTDAYQAIDFAGGDYTLGDTFTIGGKKFSFVADQDAAVAAGSDVNAIVVANGTSVAAGDLTSMINMIEQKTGYKGTADAGTATQLNFTAPTGAAAGKAGKGLTLQIGDTSDDYNKLTVSIGDMHTKSLGIDGIDISDQAGGSAAVEVIKAAINSVSSTRGDLGATQNRLDHTINNLSVMTENIQDAEANIRDVDVAEEMMAYTKNNILVQSAQAMLAQANQLPQGVLQLLQ